MSIRQLPKHFKRYNNEPWAKILNIGLRFRPIDEAMVFEIRKDLSDHHFDKEIMLPHVNLFAGLGASKSAFIEETLSNVTNKQQIFKVQFGELFLNEKSRGVRLYVSLISPELMTLRMKLFDILGGISVIDSYHLPLAKHTGRYRPRILLKSHMEREHATRIQKQCEQEYWKWLQPLNAVGLCLITLGNSHDANGEQIRLADMDPSSITHKEYPFLGASEGRG